MTIVKTPQSDPTSDAYIEIKTTYLDGGTKNVSLDADFSSAPKVALTSEDDAGTAQAISIDGDGTHSADSVDIVGNSDETVQVIAIGE